ncbi:MAG: YDG domain-containing protein [Oscillospiraceae bacterium]|nr:YDG domain-containing protein [Oscillospiraceae bacterium]
MWHRYELTNRAIALLLTFFLVFGNSSTFAEHLIDYLPVIESEEPAPLEPTEPEEPPLEGGTGEGGEIVEPPEESYPPDSDNDEKPDDGQNEENPDYIGDDDDDENNDYSYVDTEDDLDSDDYYDDDCDYDYGYYEICDYGCEGGDDCGCDCDEDCDCGCQDDREELIDDISVYFYADGAGTLSANGLLVHGEDSSGEELEGLISGDVVTFLASPRSPNAEIEWSISGVAFASGGNPGDTEATVIIPDLEVIDIDEVTVHVAFSGQATINFTVSGGVLTVPGIPTVTAASAQSLTVDLNSYITITATPFNDAHVPEWSSTGGELSGNARELIRVLTVRNDGYVHVNFITASFALTYDSSQIVATPTGNILFNTPVNFSLGSSAPISAFILWRATNDAGSLFLGQGPTASFNMPAFDTYVYLDPRSAFPITFSVTDDASTSTMTAEWSEPDLGDDSFNSGDNVPEGSTVTFEVVPADTAGLIGYEWSVNGDIQEGQTGSTFQLPWTLQATANVTVTVVRGHVVNFYSNHGTITAESTFGTTTTQISTGDLVRSGSEVVFNAQPPDNFRLYEYQWSGESVQRPPTSSNTISPHTINNLAGDQTVNLALTQGFTVDFGVDGAIGGNVVATLGGTAIGASSLQREGAEIVFTATPALGEDVNAFIWTVNNVVQQTGPLNTFTLSGLDADSNVRVSFDPGFAVTFDVGGGVGEISAAALSYGAIDSGAVFPQGTPVTVTFHAIPQIDPRYRVSHWTVNGSEQSPGENTISLPLEATTNVLVYFERVTVILNPTEVTVTGHGSAFVSSPTVAVGGTATGTINLNSDDLASLPDGLEVSASGGGINITSDDPLNDTNNGIFTVRVMRDQVEATLTIEVDLPFLRVIGDVEIINATPGLSDYFIVESNAAGNVTLVGLPTGLTYLTEPDPGGNPLHTRVTITGTRPDVTPIRFDDMVEVQLGGISAQVPVYVHLTPPPRIDSITVNPPTVNVSVHGGSPTAIFDVTGVNLYADGVNAAEVRDSLSISGSFPAWVTLNSTVNIAVHNETSATVTIPLTIQSNALNTDSRTHNLTVETIIANNVSGTLTINQGGPITLDPDNITINNANRNATISVSGVGAISVTSWGGLPTTNVHIDFSSAEDEDTIVVTSTRPLDTDVTGNFTVQVTRDGISANLLITVDLTALDDPIVTWPTGPFNAIFGNTLSNMNIPSGQGSAVFPVGGDNVPGVFTWTSPNTPVGNVASSPNNHSMTFTPTDTGNFATVTVNNVPVNVNPATPYVTWPSGPFSATYGDTIGSVARPGGSAVNPNDTPSGGTAPIVGTFEWVTPTDLVGNVPGPHTHYLRFVLADSSNFNSVADHPVSVSVGRATQSPPPVPSMTDRTAVSITLAAIPDAEFGIRVDSNIVWQSSPVFEGLTPYTEYSFYARFPENPNQFASDPSGPVTIRTLRAALGGSPSITGNAVYRETLTANTDGLYADPPGSAGGNAVLVGFTFQWYRNGMAIGGATGNTHVLGADDIDQNISVRVFVYNTEGPNNQHSASVGPVLRRIPALADLNYTLPASAEFTGSGHAVSVTGPEGIGAITVEFSRTDSSSWSSTLPVNVGVYDVRVNIAQGTRYLATIEPIVLSGQFTITRIEPTLAHLDVTIPANPTTWNDSFLTGGAPAATAVAGSGVTGLGDITIWYSLNGGPRTTTPPNTPGTVVVTVDITEGANFTAITGLWIGEYEIEGIDILSGDINVSSVNVVFDGNNHQIDVTDSGGDGSVIGTVYFSETSGGPGGDSWSTVNPLFRNATVASGILAPVTVHFRVVRHGTGYNPFFGSATVIITQRQLTWGVGGATSATVNDKVYDRDDSATVIGAPTLVGVISPDVVTVTAGNVNFARNYVIFDDVDGYVPVAVTATGWGIGGTHASNYLPPSTQPVFAEANITHRPLTITGVQATDREFVSGNFNVELTGGVLQNVVSGDDVGFILGLGTIANANIGNNRPVTTNILLSGDDAGNYTLTQPSDITVNITGRSIVGATVTVGNVVFTGNAQTPPVTVVFDSIPLVLNTDFRVVSFANNTNAGTATVIIEGIGNFSGQQSGTFQITPAPITAATVSVSGSYVFSGSAINPPAANVTVNLAPFGNLVHGTDFTFATTNNVLVSDTPVVTVTGIGNFTGTAILTNAFTINPHPISGVVTIFPSDLDPTTGAIGDGTVLTANIASLEPSGLLPPTFSGLQVEWFSSVGGGAATSIGTGNNHTVNMSITPTGTNIFVRVTGVNNFSGHIDSAFSEVGAIPLSGSISIDTSLSNPPVISDFLTLNLTGLQPSPPPELLFDVTWLRGGTVIGTGNQNNLVYTLNSNHSDFNSSISAEIIGRSPFTGSVLAPAVDIPIARPNAPTNFTVESGPNPGEITLNWSPPALTGGAPIIWYIINGGNIPSAPASETSRVFIGTYGTTYSFNLRAHNAGNLQSEPTVTLSATTFHPPEIQSITPTPETLSLLMNVRGEGETFTAVFNITGTDLNRGNNIDAVRAAFTAMAQSAMVTIGGISVSQISETSATLTISITVHPNNQPNERTCSIEVSSFIPPDDTAATTLNIRQFARVHNLYIANSPAGGSVPSGQSPLTGRSFSYGETVSLNSGDRAGYTFVNWTSSSGVTFANAAAGSTSFTMPNAPVTIVANWAQGDNAVVPPIYPDEPDSPQPTPTPAPDDPPGQGDTGSGSDTDDTESDGVESDGTDVGEVPPETGNGGDVPPELGNGSGQGSGDGSGVATPAPDNISNVAEEQDLSFMNWLSSNIWWIAILIAALVIIAAWWFILGKRRKKDKDEAPVTDLTDED